MGKFHDQRSASRAGGATSTKGTARNRADRETGGRNRGQERDLLHRTQGLSVKGKKPRTTPEALLEQAEQCLREGRPDEALPAAKRALAILQPTGQKPTVKSLPALNLLAEINIELGDGDAAREYFLQAVDLDPEGTIPESQGGGVEKFLWLAQLSEDGGQDSVDWFERGAEVLKREIGKRMDGRGDAEPDDGVKGLLGKLANVLCGIVEIYMTDLSWSPTAEPRCESLIAEALLSSPSTPEPLQTLASIRISQSRIPEARTALRSSMALWQHSSSSSSENDNPSAAAMIVVTPDFPTRISLARLLMEVEMEEEALAVVERLVAEEDQSIEAWYLGGWCLYLLGQKNQKQQGSASEIKYDAPSLDKTMTKPTASFHSSRSWLRQSLTLYKLLEYEDERLRDHAQELVRELDRMLGEEESGNGGDGDDDDDGMWESEDEDDEGEDDGDGVEGDGDGDEESDTKMESA